MPSWFDLNKYDATKNLNLLQWSQILTSRMGAFYDFRKSGHEKGKLALEEIIRRPIPSGYLSCNLYSHIFSDELQKEPWKNYSVWPLKASEVFFLQLILRENFPDLRILEQMIFDAQLRKLPNELEEKINRPYDLLLPTGECVAHAVINLEATDEQIISDFKIYLTHFRKALKNEVAKKNFGEEDFNEWIKYSVLPYIDLSIWEKYNDITLRRVSIAHALFPNAAEEDFDPDERLKTTRNKAEELLRWETITAMNWQLAAMDLPKYEARKKIGKKLSQKKPGKI